MQSYNRRQDTGATTDSKAPAGGRRYKIKFKRAGGTPGGTKKLNVVQALAFQGCLQRAVHQDLGKVRCCLVQFVDALANQFVISAWHRVAKSGDGIVD